MASGIAIAGMAAVLTVGTGSAVAAPTGPSANETIARLQAEGNNVVVNKVGAGQECSITSVQRVRTPVAPSPRGRTMTGNPQMGNAFQQHPATVHVGVHCR
ncbi:hypothetical protein QGN32_00800 [Mycolicibacterium sp. ND9-15]|uniref:hypothetical protein n=1 Tax=Mycolicibacterium sp. ND9-15 TaxID=3042320 RepID=UPI002DD9420D|nr:hypothetical protein [Mycolicibacterium sp. ND9-15]WSE56517.1 hypothetical protein QGN32_00800 [Mycolicibacterium sp. ND9-15]